MISAVIITKNEQERIGRCLATLSWCDELIVVDDYSTDETAKIAKRFGAKVFKRHLNDDFANQRNFGLKKAKGEWVFFVDADEKVSKALATEVEQAIQSQKKQDDLKVGYYLKRRDYIFGRWLKFGETGRTKLLRLARRTSGKWERPVHEVWKVSGSVGALSNPLLHYPHQSVAQFLKALNTYSTLHAKVLAKQGHRSSWEQILLYPLAKFSRNYLWYLGLLDDMPGFIHALLMSFHSFLARAKLWLLVHNRQSTET